MRNKFKFLCWKLTHPNYNQMRKKIINFVKTSAPFYNDADISEAIEFLRNNPLHHFPYSFISNYRPENHRVLLAPDTGLRYTLHNGNKLFWRAGRKAKRIRGEYASLCAEQDEKSPHRYCTPEFEVHVGDIVVDIGCAEGNFSLDIVERAAHVYLFEADERWVQALNETFRPWLHKVTICRALVSKNSREGCISIDDYFASKPAPTFFKIDVEGHEQDILEGARLTLSRIKNARAVICTYHRQDDETEIPSLLHEFGFSTEFSRGYMLMYRMENFNEPYFRRGLLRAEKGIRSIPSLSPEKKISLGPLLDGAEIVAWPIVTIIIPCFNQGQFILETIDSALNQKFQKTEIIVIDDNSTDKDTKTLLRGIKNPNVKIVFNNTNQGVSETRNIGIRMARGIFILPLDADDLIAPEFIHKTLNALISKNADVVYTNTLKFGVENKLMRPRKFNVYGMLKRNLVVNTALYRKSAWAQVGGYSSELKTGLEDWDFWLSLLQIGKKFHHINEVLFLYRQNEKSRTNEAKENNEALCEIIQTRHQKLFSLYGAGEINSKKNWLNKTLSSSINRTISLYNWRDRPTARQERNESAIDLFYYNPKAHSNFGDQLNLPLINLLTGKKVAQKNSKEATHVCIGSLLESFLRNKDDIDTPKKTLNVWGSGFITAPGEHPTFTNKLVEEFLRPVRFHAVRGLITLNRIKEMGYSVDGIAVGDPGLLSGLLIDTTQIKKKYRIGLIPHYADQQMDSFSIKNQNSKNVTTLNILDKPHVFLEKLAECEVVVSSAMHGLIAADALGIPNIWAKVSNRLTGGDYKFKDYYSAYGLTPKSITLEDLNALTIYDIDKIENGYPIKPSAVNKLTSDIIASFPYFK